MSKVGSTEQGKADLREMYESWPFFATNIGENDKTRHTHEIVLTDIRIRY